MTNLEAEKMLAAGRKVEEMEDGMLGSGPAALPTGAPAVAAPHNAPAKTTPPVGTGTAISSSVPNGTLHSAATPFIPVDDEFVAGKHFFTAATAFGRDLCVAHGDLETAIDEVGMQLELILRDASRRRPEASLRPPSQRAGGAPTGPADSGTCSRWDSARGNPGARAPLPRNRPRG